MKSTAESRNYSYSYIRESQTFETIRCCMCYLAGASVCLGGCVLGCDVCLDLDSNGCPEYLQAKNTRREQLLEAVLMAAVWDHSSTSSTRVAARECVLCSVV